MRMKLLSLAALVSILTSGSVLTANYLDNTAFADDTNSNTSNTCIKEEEVKNAQNAWAQAIVDIGKVHKDEAKYKALAEETVDTLYAYDEGKVLFKPTKALEKQFRLTEEEAVSYFVTGDVEEDKGFALQPWSKVEFENADITLGCNYAVAMGNYFFTDANTKKKTTVEYTFGYLKNKEGKLLINVHHSSLPFNPPSK